MADSCNRSLSAVGDLAGNVFGGIGRSLERSLTALFGSSNARYVKKLQPKVDAINALEPKYQAMSDEELRQQTVEFREAARRRAKRSTTSWSKPSPSAARRAGGSSACGTTTCSSSAAWCCTAARSPKWSTGEGKTLVATLPAYLNALEGKGVHVVTVNDYLARRDMEWMGPLYMGLGLTVGAIYSDMEPLERQKAYVCDITYGTNNEFGFDYLRDNMKPAARGDDRFPSEQQQVAAARCTTRSSTKSTTF